MKGKHDPNRTARRHGSDPAKVPLGGRMVKVDEPRVRSVDGKPEATLDASEHLTSTELLNRHALIAMLAGVSTRHYADVLEPVGAGVELTRGEQAVRRTATLMYADWNRRSAMRRMVPLTRNASRSDPGLHDTPGSGCRTR
ncbi:MAG: hypothetical protein ACYCVN_00720 [Acidimicrobiales bacterium]